MKHNLLIPIHQAFLADTFARNRALFADFRMEADGGDGGTGGSGDGGSGSDGGKGDEFTPITSQDDFNKRISDRIRRERDKFADYDDLKKKAEAHDAAAEAAKTEAEKAVDAARVEGEKTATEKANARIVRAEAKALAATAKFRDPADAVAFLDLSKVTVNEDGDVDAKALGVALADLAKEKPYLVDDGKGGTPRPDRTQGGGSNDDKPSVDRGRDMFTNRKGGKKPAQQSS